MRIAVIGASGRLGSLATQLVTDEPDMELHAAITSSHPLSDIHGADVVFDATNFEVSTHVVREAQTQSIPVVVGTSGWSQKQISLLDATQSPVLIVPNFSLGSVVGSAIAAWAAPYFETVEIVETHHARKIDAPGGTAVRTAELIARARREAGVHSPVPPSTLPARGAEIDGIPVHSLRLDGVVAEQQVNFGRRGESLRIEHITTSPDSYSAGILLALRTVSSLTGVTVGLDSLLDIPGRS